jgi:hypothetical protein
MPDPGARRVAQVLIVLGAVLRLVASTLGLLVPNVYHEDARALGALPSRDRSDLVSRLTCPVTALLGLPLSPNERC